MQPADYKIITDPALIEIEKWDRFISTHPEGNCFQGPEMFHFLKNIPGHDPFAFFITDPDLNILGIFSGVIRFEGTGILKFFSRRAVVTGGPVLSDSLPDKAIIDLLNITERRIGKQIIYLEIRNLAGQENLRDLIIHQGFQYQPYVNYHVDLDTYEQVNKRIHNSKRRQIKSSMKNGAVIAPPSGEKEVSEFYRILKELYRNKVKKPLPEWEFFRKFYHTPILGRYLLVKYHHRVIGGIMCPVHKNETIYEWYVGGMDRKFKGIFPSVLATWAPMEYGLKNKFRLFDFMGAGQSDREYGVRQFKAQFGGRLINNGRYTRIQKPILYMIGKTGINLWKMFRR